MDNLTEKEKNLLYHVAYVALEDDRLASRILREVFEEFDDVGDEDTADALLEKLEKFID